MSDMEKKMSYASAKERLEEILSQLESGELNVDDLGRCVKEATELIEFCKKRLHETEEEVKKVQR